MRPPWNHNIHYHDIVLRAIPKHCNNALDIGCGEGILTRQLASHCAHVTGIDLDQNALLLAQSEPVDKRIEYIHGDALTHSFPDGSFDLITAVAALHHLPLRPALERFSRLLRKDGVLVVIGLRRPATLTDYCVSAMAFPASWLLRCFYGHHEVRAPIQEPLETLSELRAAFAELLPGSVTGRHLLFRYSMIWRKVTPQGVK